jgi:WD40 repeat protein
MEAKMSKFGIKRNVSTKVFQITFLLIFVYNSFRRYGGWESSPLPTVVMDLSSESTSIAKLNKAPLPNSCYCRCKYKALYLRHTRVMSNWKNRRFTATCQLRGHDEHVITCLQIKGDLIVTGSDDNTIRVWSAATATVSKKIIFGH